jgi:hypothetical protein
MNEFNQVSIRCWDHQHFQTWEKSGIFANSSVWTGPSCSPSEEKAAAKFGGLCATNPIEVNMRRRLSLLLEVQKVA